MNDYVCDDVISSVFLLYMTNNISVSTCYRPKAHNICRIIDIPNTWNTPRQHRIEHHKTPSKISILLYTLYPCHQHRIDCKAFVNSCGPFELLGNFVICCEHLLKAVLILALLVCYNSFFMWMCFQQMEVKMFTEIGECDSKAKTPSTIVIAASPEKRENLRELITYEMNIKYLSMCCYTWLCYLWRINGANTKLL